MNSVEGVNIFEEMASALESYAIKLREYANEKGEEGWEQLPVIAEDLQIMGNDLEQYEEEDLPVLKRVERSLIDKIASYFEDEWEGGFDPNLSLPLPIDETMADLVDKYADDICGYINDGKNLLLEFYPPEQVKLFEEELRNNG